MSEYGHEKIILQLQKQVKQLTHKLSYYENPHPHHQKILLNEESKSKMQGKRDSDSSKSKRGGIAGHKGATQKFIPTSTTHHKSSNCPKCAVQTFHKLKFTKE